MDRVYVDINEIKGDINFILVIEVKNNFWNQRWKKFEAILESFSAPTCSPNRDISSDMDVITNFPSMSESPITIEQF